ncbi:hypothetical protein Tco_1272678 [Tanacetum coccineum]
MTKGETSTPTREQNIALQCPKLNESNYTTWAIMMETILKAYGLWETLEATEKVDERKIHTTKAMILTTLPEDILMQVAQYETAKEVWESIKKLLEISLIIPPAMDVVNFGDKNGPKGGVIFEPYDYGPLEDSYPRQSKMENVEVHDMEVPFMVPTELLAIQRIP